jgi:hypothetical protein
MPNLLSRFKIQDILDRDTDKFEPRPRRAWAAVFSLATTLITLVLVSHLYLYLYMHTDGSFKPDDSSVGVIEVKLNRKGLTEVNAMFEAKNTQFEDLLVSPPKIVDPSEGMSREVAPTNQSAIVVSPQKKTLPKNTASTLIPL